MEPLILKKCLVILFIAITLTSHAQDTEKMKLIAYGTPGFEEFVKNAPISLEESWRIQIKFYKENPKGMDYHVWVKNSVMYFVSDKYYVYTFRPLSKMKPKGSLLGGIWVDSISGEAKYDPNDTVIEAESFVGYSRQ